MKVATYQREIDFCLVEASRLLGAPAHAVYLDWDLGQRLRGKLKFVGRRGFSDTGPLLSVGEETGHFLYSGLESFRLPLGEQDIPLVFVSVPSAAEICDFWAVRQCDARAVYRYVRRLVRRDGVQPPPVLDEPLRQRLYDNTIGFLRRGRALLRRYGVAAKRGVLLLGEPGNGKTMACRHLRAQCLRRGLSFRSVTVDRFEQACKDKRTDRLFQPDRPGIVLFDDFDALLAERGTNGLSSTQTLLLGQLDGVAARHDVAFVFTSNLDVERVDFALRRPGRIDVVLAFPRPTAALRRRLIVERWHEDIRAALDVDRAVDDTDGLSFAEIEEVRKLLVLRFVETDRWDWQAAIEGIRARGRDVRPRQKIGFAAPNPRSAMERHADGPAARGREV